MTEQKIDQYIGGIKVAEAWKTIRNLGKDEMNVSLRERTNPIEMEFVLHQLNLQKEHKKLCRK